jgi:hypothetical protein
MMYHFTTIAPDPSQVYAGVKNPRCRWECSCGKFGDWHERARNARYGASAHVSRLAIGNVVGRKIEEHW